MTIAQKQIKKGAEEGKQKVTDQANLQEELQSKKLQLHWLLQITKAINYNFSTKQLLDVYEHVLTSQLKVGRVVLFIHNGAWRNALMVGVDENFASAAANILKGLNVGKKIEDARELWEKTFELVTPVFHKDRVLAYGLMGGFGDEHVHERKELLSFIQTITNLIVVAIENNKMAEEGLRQAAMKKELELAAQMQSMLFPHSLPSNDRYEIHATYLPHQEVGGDYYDYIAMSDDEFAICMADVSGKGIPAALLMANFQANLHALIHMGSREKVAGKGGERSAIQSPNTNRSAFLTGLAHELNAKVFASAKGEKFITFFIGIYNVRTQELQYFNAGHNPPFLVHNKVVYQLTDGSTGLGMFEQLPFINVGKLLIPDRALLLCYTDGVTELENEKGEAFGEERLKSFLLDLNTRPIIQSLGQEVKTGNIITSDAASLTEVHAILLETLNNFRQAQAHLDDVTLLSCRFFH